MRKTYRLVIPFLVLWIGASQGKTTEAEVKKTTTTTTTENPYEELYSYPMGKCICRLNLKLEEIRDELLRKEMAMVQMLMMEMNPTGDFSEDELELFMGFAGHSRKKRSHSWQKWKNRHMNKKTSQDGTVQEERYEGVRYDYDEKPQLCTCKKKKDQIIISFTLMSHKWLEALNEPESESYSLLTKDLLPQLGGALRSGELQERYVETTIALYNESSQHLVQVWAVLTLDNWYYDSMDLVQEAIVHCWDLGYMHAYRLNMTTLRIYSAETHEVPRHPNLDKYPWRWISFPIALLILAFVIYTMCRGEICGYRFCGKKVEEDFMRKAMEAKY